MIKSLTDSPQVVLLVSIDTLRQDHAGCYGYSRNTTPFIDSLATQGRHYMRAFTPIPVTFPAHGSIFTSRYPGWNGVSVQNGGWLPPGSTWVRLLNRAGILTAGFVSSFVLDGRMTNGFDLGHYDDAMTLTELNRDMHRRRGETTVDACLEWLAAAPKDTRVFCFLHLMDVHATYDVPGTVGSQFVRHYYEEVPLPICEIFSPGGIPNIYRLDKLPDFPGKQAGAYYVDRYDGCIAYVDQQVQRLIDGLVKTISPWVTCFVVSDHGEAFGEDGYWCTHSQGVLPNQTQIPFIVWSSRLDSIAGLVDSSKPVSLLDIGPTVLDLFGVPPDTKERRHGWSLFDHSKHWATRRLFSISCTQMLAYNEEAKEGVVIGDQTTSYNFTFNVRQRCSYLNRDSAPSEDLFAEGMIFHSLSKYVGSPVKPIAVAYIERQEEALIAQRLASLGYIDSASSGADTRDIDDYTQSLSLPQGDVDWKLPRAKADVLAREFQVRPALDLGCGSIKVPGFLGMDRYAMPGVDLIGDLDAPLPFPDDTFDLVLASHALEHVQDLVATMKEIYRVCRHGAQVCIVAPYFSQGINFANPYHKQGFNEHTPRFWTANPETTVELVEYCHPHAESWALSQSDHGDPRIDFRCMRMEFFYFPEYRNLPPEEQRAARKKYLDVCDQIMYHLVAVKEPMSEAEMEELAKRIEYYDPPYVAIRRLQEQLDSREAELKQARADLAERDSMLNQAQSAVDTRTAELEEARGVLAEREAGLQQMQATIAAREAESSQMQAALATREEESRRLKAKARAAAAELDEFRHRRTIRWFNRFSRADASDDISPTFQQLKDDSYIFTRDLNGFRLQPGASLQRVPFVTYPFDLGRPNLAGLLLAPILDAPVEGGVIGIEIVSPTNQIVVQETLPLSQIDPTVPVRFSFAPIRDSDRGRFWLRVFVRNVDDPVRIFEWRKPTLFGFGPLQTKAFCGFVFQPDR